MGIVFINLPVLTRYKKEVFPAASRLKIKTFLYFLDFGKVKPDRFKADMLKEDLLSFDFSRPMIKYYPLCSSIFKQSQIFKNKTQDIAVIHKTLLKLSCEIFSLHIHLHTGIDVKTTPR